MIKHPISSLACAVALTLVFTSSALGQGIFNLKDAADRAATQNPEVKLRLHNLEAAKQERAAARGAWYPRVDLEASTGPNQMSRPSLPSALSYNNSRAVLQLRQTLFDGFATSNEVRRLSYGEQVAFYELVTATQQISLEVVRAYTDVLRYRELVTLASSNFTTHQEVHDRLRQKVAAGVGRRVDLEQAAGRMALAESNWITEASNLHDVSARYQRLVGESPAGSLSPLSDFGGVLPKSIDFLPAAVQRSPEFKGAVATVRAYRSDRDARKGPNYPTLELRARQSVEDNQSGIPGNYRDSALELVLNYNLFRGGSDRARVNQAAAKLNSAFDLRDKACRDVWQTGQIAFNDSTKLVNQLRLLAEHELATSKAREAYQQQFDIGQRSLLDLLDTENELYQARRALTMGEFDLKLAEARVLSANGSLLSVLGLAPSAETLPDANGAREEDDELLRCSMQPIPSVALNRAFDSRPAPTPSPVTQAAPVVAAANPSTASCKQIPVAMDNWLKAWNGKRVDAYLSAYAPHFVAALGLSRPAWEKLRRARVAEKPGDITAQTTNIQTTSCDGKTAQLSFTQSYGSKDYRDIVEKTLSLEHMDGKWLITREAVTKGRNY